MQNNPNDVVIAYYIKGYGYTNRHILTINYTQKTYNYSDIFKGENIDNVTQKVFDLLIREIKRLEYQVLCWGFKKVD